LTDGFDHLRLIVTGGDVFPPECVRLWQQSPLKSIPVVNAYGPTEAVVTSVAGHVTPDEAAAIAIGSIRSELRHQ